jgi:hypothetical protein
MRLPSPLPPRQQIPSITIIDDQPVRTHTTHVHKVSLCLCAHVCAQWVWTHNSTKHAAVWTIPAFDLGSIALTASRSHSQVAQFSFRRISQPHTELEVVLETFLRNKPLVSLVLAYLPLFSLLRAFAASPSQPSSPIAWCSGPCLHSLTLWFLHV